MSKAQFLPVSLIILRNSGVTVCSLVCVTLRHMSIWDRNKTVKYYEWVTTMLPRTIDRIPVGDYVLVEAVAPEGYAKSADVYFTVANTGAGQNVSMVDRPIVASFAKKDSSARNNIEGAFLQLYEADSGWRQGELYAAWVSGVTPYVIEGIPAGNYIIIKGIRQKCFTEPLFLWSGVLAAVVRL